MPTLGLAEADAAVLIEFLGRRKTAEGTKGRAASTGAPPQQGARSSSLYIDPYLRMQQALNRDDVRGNRGSRARDGRRRRQARTRRRRHCKGRAAFGPART